MYERACASVIYFRQHEISSFKKMTISSALKFANLWFYKIYDNLFCFQEKHIHEIAAWEDEHKRQQVIWDNNQEYMDRALWKRGLMHVRKVSSQISLSSPHMLIKDDTFRFYDIFPLKKVSS